MNEQENEAKDFDSVADNLLNKMGDGDQTESSTVEQPEDVNQDGKTSGAEPVKTDQVKAVENDRSLSVEEKIAKIKELLGEDEKAIDAYIKQKGYHNDPAWQKQRELIEKLKKDSAISGLSKEDKLALDEFKKYRSSPDYIQQSMKAQGYTQEAIDKKLQESGFDVKSKPQDDVNLVIEKLNLDPNNITEDMKANISDISKIMDVILNDRLNKVLPKELEPVKNHIDSITKNDSATKMINTMKDTIKSESILDFEKDVEPELNKFMDENPDCTQQDVFEHFRSLNHRLTVERLKAGNKKEERNEKRTNLRQNVPSFSATKTNAKKTGNFENDADAFLDSINI